MIRMLVFYILPMLLLAGAYLLWLYYRRNQAVSYKKIIIAAAVLIGIIIGAFTLRGEDFTANSSYTAPKLQNGQIIPAKITPNTAKDRT